MDVQKIMENFYANSDEDSRLMGRCGNVEFITTVTYIEKYLRPGMRVLEIGAGTGRYSHYLARQGYHVDAVELTEHNIEIFRENTQLGENVTITQGSATDIATFASEQYDITLLLGPMYHLFTEKEKLAALSEAIRVTKKGGVVFAAYCMSDPSIMMYGFIKGHIHELMERNMLDPVTFKAFSSPQEIFELHRKQDIDALRMHFDVTQLHFVAADGYANHMRTVLPEMDDKTYALYVKYHLATCENQELVGYSNHTIDIFRKN
ncbi:MAG: methyltransferase domain-containing protein [Clostridia bacterium]|nr:methyltransferase domain-containing protein [Clostridia bacterium]